VAERLDATFERRVSEEVGLPVTLFRTDAPGAPPHLASLRDDALAAGRTVADLIDTLGVYVAATPLPFAATETGLGVQAMLPREAAVAPVRRLTRELGVWAVVVVALAGLVALLVARRAGRPLAPLIAATARMGRGDFASPVPRAGLIQINALAAAMEDMRVRLLRLTAELQRRQADAEAVLSGISEGVFTVDADRRIRYLNPQAAALLGVTEHDAVGRFCGDVLNPQGPRGERPCEEDCPIVHARFRGGARAAEHLSLPGGRLRTVVIKSAPPSAEGETAEGAGPLQFQLVRDETDFEATRRLRDTLVANISHEFRTPLSAQLASIEMLRERAGDLTSAEAQNLLQSIERGSLRLTRLIDNLLESLRIEAGEDSVRRSPVALDQVVEEAVESTGPLLEQREQKLSVDLPYPLPAVLGDATRLTQALVNLLANANKFAPAGSSVRIGGAVREREVELWVEDEGPGLPDGGDRSIFERFVRAPGEEPEESGVGLGLWIVKSIAERHGGRVEAQNLEPGTRVSVVLPRE
jgi:signal transduction histidine kinase/HAMP domain-containing protein